MTFSKFDTKIQIEEATHEPTNSDLLELNEWIDELEAELDEYEEVETELDEHDMRIELAEVGYDEREFDWEEA